LLEEYCNKTMKFVDEDKIQEALQMIETALRNKISFDFPDNISKCTIASIYLDIADSLKMYPGELENCKLYITKCLQLYKKYSDNLPNQMLFDIKLNTARANSIRYDLAYVSNHNKYSNSNLIDYLNLKSIYDIDNYLLKAIKLYRECLIADDVEKNEYDIQNNLGQLLSRSGRFCESLSFFKSNNLKQGNRWQSLANYGDILNNLLSTEVIPQTLAANLNICESYLKALKNEPPRVEAENIKLHLARNEMLIDHWESKLTGELMYENRKEESEHFSQMTLLRKYSLENSLTLNEHSIYCNCNDSAKDMLSFSSNFEDKKLRILDGIINRIVSEYGFSRLLFFNHISGVSNSSNDILFTESAQETDLLGYHIEQLRTCYRNIYSILDKIMNGIFIQIGLKRNSEDYFESFFSTRNKELNCQNSIHLAALYSISCELNQNNGAFKHFKKFRNQMEHNYLPINDLEADSITLDQLEEFTFNLLKLTRSSIMSFYFYIKSEQIKNTNDN